MMSVFHMSHGPVSQYFVRAPELSAIGLNASATRFGLLGLNASATRFGLLGLNASATLYQGGKMSV